MKIIKKKKTQKKRIKTKSNYLDLKRKEMKIEQSYHACDEINIFIYFLI